MKVIVVGGAASGMGVIARLLRLSPKTKIVLYQKSSYISLGACGLPYFIADHFHDKDMMLARTPDYFREKGVKVNINSEVINIDFDKKQIKYIKNNNENEIYIDNYDELVLSVGAKPITFNEINKYNNTYTLTTLEDGEIVKENIAKNKEVKNVLIIGSGFIGLEIAENLKGIGKKIYISDLSDYILAKQYDKEFSEEIKSTLLENNVNLLLNNRAINFFNKDDKITKVLFENGIEIDIDAIITAVGFKPNTDFLRDTKIKLEKNGAIKVDNYGKTNIPHVWSLGDCSTSKNVITERDVYSPLATIASKFAKVVADNILNNKKIFYGSLQTSIIKIFDKSFARTGLTESEAKDLGYNTMSVLIKDKDRTSYVKNQKDINLKLILDLDKNILIGAQMSAFGDAILRIHSLIQLIWNKIEITDYTLQVDLPYSPPFAKTSDIINIALSELVKKGKK